MAASGKGASIPLWQGGAATGSDRGQRKGSGTVQAAAVAASGSGAAKGLVPPAAAESDKQEARPSSGWWLRHCNLAFSLVRSVFQGSPAWRAGGCAPSGDCFGGCGGGGFRERSIPLRSCAWLVSATTGWLWTVVLRAHSGGSMVPLLRNRGVQAAAQTTVTVACCRVVLQQCSQRSSGCAYSMAALECAARAASGSGARRGGGWCAVSPGGGRECGKPLKNRNWHGQSACF